MNADKLVRMANEIAAFFRPYPEEEACAGIQDHLQAFWTRRMLDLLLAHAAAGGAGLDPRVARALAAWPRGDSPLAKEMASPGIGGQLASDAG